MALEPLARLVGDLFERARFFEQVRRAWHDDEFLLASKQRVSFSIHVDHRLVVATDDQKRRGGDLGEVRLSQVRSPSSGNDSRDHGGIASGCLQGCSRSCAGAEVADPKMCGAGILSEPRFGQQETVCEQIDVENLVAIL